MNAQALTHPTVGTFSWSRPVPALLAAVAAVAVAASVAFVVVDGGTDAGSSGPAAEITTPMERYVDTLIQRKAAYMASLPE